MQGGEWFDDEIGENVLIQEVDSMTLRDWQLDAKKFFFNNNCNAIFEVVTGAGKTYIAVDIINEILKINPDTKVLIVVPKNVILETGWYKELVDAGFPIQKIGVYYGNIKEYAQVTLTNMQNIHKIPLELFDMAIFDECHNYPTEKKLPIIYHDFKYKIGLTATLSRQDNKHVQLLKAFNYNVFKYTPEEALADEVLNPFEFVNIGINLDYETKEKYDELTQLLNNIYRVGGSFDKIMKSTGPLKLKMLSTMNERKMLINNYKEKFIIAKQIIKKHQDNKIIVFNQFNAQTTKMYWHLLEDNIDCRYFHSGVDKATRDQTLIDFRNDKFNVILTSKVLDEGYNLPKLDVAIIMAGDSTDKQTIQRMGRVLRKKNTGNSLLYQMYCKDTFEEIYALERSKTFKALCVHYNEIEYLGGETIQI